MRLSGNFCGYVVILGHFVVMLVSWGFFCGYTGECCGGMNFSLQSEKCQCLLYQTMCLEKLMKREIYIYVVFYVM